MAFIRDTYKTGYKGRLVERVQFCEGVDQFYQEGELYQLYQEGELDQLY